MSLTRGRIIFFLLPAVLFIIGGKEGVYLCAIAYNFIPMFINKYTSLWRESLTGKSDGKLWRETLTGKYGGKTIAGNHGGKLQRENYSGKLQREPHTTKNKLPLDKTKEVWYTIYVSKNDMGNITKRKIWDE